MPKNTRSIPVNKFGGEGDSGIVSEKLAFRDLPGLGEWVQPERHDRHSFFLLEKGSVTIEIDFQTYEIKSPSIIYMHPNQVHLIVAFKQLIVSSWAIDNENLNPEYLQLLEDIVPARPLPLDKEKFSLISDAVSVCIKFAARKKDRLHHAALKDSCNALIALVLSFYIDRTISTEKLTRAGMVARRFRETLEKHFARLKRPSEYAQRLNLSTPYLNECVKNATGYPVSYHIQQRVILEAKRLLYHSDQSVKEIASALGYDDYPYFSRLFSKAVGMSALAFRKKNRD
jgi:AraC family transcriptional regulator, transcriptional activator of pobA